VSHSHPCTRLPRLRHCVTRPFTSTWLWRMPCATVAFVNEKLPRLSCTFDCVRPMPNSILNNSSLLRQLLRPLLGELVFVGGSVAGYSSRMRQPVNRARRWTWTQSQKSHRTRSMPRLGTATGPGIQRRHERKCAVVRWVHRGTILDVMPLDEHILGFSNRWYLASPAIC